MRELSIIERRSVSGGIIQDDEFERNPFDPENSDYAHGYLDLGLLSASNGGAQCTLSTKLEDNRSTTVILTCGSSTWTWNSGIAFACYTVGVGVGLMAMAFTAGNPAAAGLIGFLSARGCSLALSP
jgi:hypothetical protein